MDVAAYQPGVPAGSSTPTATKMRPLFDTPSGSDRIPSAMLRRSAGTENETSDSATSSADVTPISSSTAGAASYSAALLWHPEDDTNVDQDDGWQLVGTKTGIKGPHQLQTPCSTASSASSSKGQVCGRCGMRGHLTARCKQPYCNKCKKWWHTEEECAHACSTCGSLDHRVCGGSLCKSYKCRECGLYGHVYAECPNIRCNLCREIGHKALDCPSIVCNICKQKGHKAVNCLQPRHSSGGASKSSTPEMQHLHLVAPAPSQLQQCSSNCSSVASPMSATSPAGAADAAAVTPGQSTAACSSSTAAVDTAAGGSSSAQQEVPLVQQAQRPFNLAEQQQIQQQQSRLLGQLFKVAPELAVSCLDDSRRLQALYSIEPQYLSKLLQGLTDQSPVVQKGQLEAAVRSAQRQIQATVQQQQQSAQLMTPTHQQQAVAHQGQQPSRQRVQLLAGQILQQQQRPGLSRSTPASPAGPAPAASTAACAGEDADATHSIKPGDLAPQHARALQEEFGDMLPSRWQQLPSWRQLEARLSFPDGNYVQRRLQFRENRRQLQLLTLQLLTLQLRSSATGRHPSSVRVAGTASASCSPATRPGARVVPAMLAAVSPAANGVAAMTTQQQQQQQPPASRPAGTPCSYAAALAGSRAAPAGPQTAAPQSSEGSSNCRPIQVSSSPFAGSDPPAAASPASGAAASGVAVCSRCGMLGHTSSGCVQPRCSRCHLWWHTEAQCNTACQFCGSLDHSGDAEQPSSCKSFRCKACKMFGHTASICPHVQLHHQQLQSQGSSLSSSSLQPSPRSSKTGAAGSSGGGGQPLSNGSSESSLCPPDSPGLGQHGVKPKDLLPEHARALQEEFPNALPPGWQQMGSWRMVEERLRVVAVEGAVFSKRRQMWRDRRKHYQALTAQALAAAARSAAAAADAEDSVGPGGGSSVSSSSCRGDSGASSPSAGERQCAAQLQQELARQAEEQQQPQAVQPSGSPAGPNNPINTQQQAAAGQQQPAVASAAANQPQQQASDASKPQPLQQQQQQQQPEELQQCPADDPVVVPEWQQQQGSLFSLVDLAPGAGHHHLDSAGGPGSAFSCDMSFCCSTPVPADTSSMMLSSLTDSLGCSGSSTPVMPASGGSSIGATPGGLAILTGRSSLSAAVSSPLPASLACGTPVPTPRSALAAAAAAGAASAGRVGYGVVPGEVGKGRPYSPMPSICNPGMMRSPLGYPGPPSSPMDMHSAAAAAMAAAGRGPPVSTMGAPGPTMYQQMMVAQRQSQLQQQMMLQGRSTRGMEQPQLTSPQQQQQQHMLLQMQMQQQAHAHAQTQVQAHAQAQAQAQAAQQQLLMQRQARMDQAFMLQQQQPQRPAFARVAQQKPGPPGLSDEPADGGELDDKLGVLGVLGLQ